MKKIICALLVAAFVAATASGCTVSFGSGGQDSKTDSSESQSSASQASPADSSTPESSSADEDSCTALSKKPKAELLSSFSADDMTNIGGFKHTDHSIYYYTGSYENDADSKYGIINSDTNKVEDAVYTFMDEAKYENSSNHEKSYLVCSKATSSKSISDMNSVGLISTTGEELVPLKYASIQVLNDKYAKVVTVTSETSSKGDALVYKNPDSAWATVGMSDNATLYKGKWQIYDLEKKALVKGVEGTSTENISARGGIIKVGSEKYYSSTGDQLENITKLLDNGCYTVENGGITHVNDSDGNKLFQFDNKAVSLYGAFSDLTFIERVNDVYYVVDKSGNKISGDFEKSVTKEGDYYFKYIDDGYEMYDINAKKVYNGNIKYYNYNKIYGVMRITDSDDNYIFLDSDANIIGKLSKSNAEHGDSLAGVAYQSSGSKYNAYCYADKSFSIECPSYPKTCFFMTLSNDKGVISALDKTKLVDENYTTITTNGYGLVLAKKTDGSADLYKISMS